MTLKDFDEGYAIIAREHGKPILYFVNGKKINSFLCYTYCDKEPDFKYSITCIENGCSVYKARTLEEIIRKKDKAMTEYKNFIGHDDTLKYYMKMVDLFNDMIKGVCKV